MGYLKKCLIALRKNSVDYSFVFEILMYVHGVLIGGFNVAFNRQRRKALVKYYSAPISSLFPFYTLPLMCRLCDVNAVFFIYYNLSRLQSCSTS